MSWLTKVAFGKSFVHGMGVFALEPIKRGTKVWTVDPSMKFANPAQLAALPVDEMRFALHGGYLHYPSQRFVYYKDGMEYVNHAAGQLSNIGITEWTSLMEDNCTALRDIEVGEELLEDYTFWSVLNLRRDHWLVDLYRQFCPEHFSFLAKIEKEHIRKTARLTCRQAGGWARRPRTADQCVRSRPDPAARRPAAGSDGIGGPPSSRRR